MDDAAFVAMLDRAYGGIQGGAMKKRARATKAKSGTRAKRATRKASPRERHLKQELTIEKRRLARAVQLLADRGMSQVEIEQGVGIGMGTGAGALRRVKEAEALPEKERKRGPIL